ncbi:MAG: ribonuclease H-like domain-containing protein [Treponema sp.]|jgi:uncharacterized protein YprB with RNaseH-like and TPR domain|nr:ribonuclease H-like domain-containing protein [Treponema sp.]
MNLRKRLQVFKAIAKKQEPMSRQRDVFSQFPPGWNLVANGVLKRVEYVRLDRRNTADATGLAILVPDFLPRLALVKRGMSRFKPLVFFDFETTGLSGGAGTIAFLAAFGHFENTEDVNVNTLKITQYLLLDYPAERDFLRAFLPEFRAASSHQSMDIKADVVTYNGKCFDFQILRTRCLMNSLEPPIFNAIDLLHPCRRLWKRLLSSCSQASIETAVLGLDRSDDIPGSFAPEIWFSFLKTGEISNLLRICEHNQQDVFGLASIFTVFEDISRDPFGALSFVDHENIALWWREMLRRYATFLEENCEKTEIRHHWETSRRLLESTKDYPRSAFALALDLFKEGRRTEGRKLLASIISSGDAPIPIKARALHHLAFDAEKRLQDTDAALSYLDTGLAMKISATLREYFNHRKNRLLTKRNIVKD